jgi:hypothetical protein
MVRPDVSRRQSSRVGPPSSFHFYADGFHHLFTQCSTAAWGRSLGANRLRELPGDAELVAADRIGWRFQKLRLAISNSPVSKNDLVSHVRAFKNDAALLSKVSGTTPVFAGAFVA